ncbi:MAG: transglutaminase-like domain-containing protein [bacterium]
MNSRAAVHLSRSCGVFVACMVACTEAGLARADWTLVEERYFTLTLAGKPCGRSHEAFEKGIGSDEGRVRTRTKLEMRFRRLGTETVIDLASDFVETVTGDPVVASISQNGAPALRYEFAPGAGAGVAPTKVVVLRGEVREDRELAIGEWLTPREAAAFVEARVKAGAAGARYRTLDVQTGLAAVEIGMRRGGAEKLQLGERTLDVTRYTVTNSLMPVEANERYDAAGSLVSSTTPIGLGDLVSTLATKAEADAAYAAASFDLLAGTFAKTKRIERWSSRPTLALEIRAKGDRLDDLPTVGAQAVTRVDARTAMVDIDLMRASGSEPGDLADPRWNAPNAVIDSDAPAVRELLAKAKLAPRKDDEPAFALLARAEALRELVARHLRDKNLATAFASASEAVRARGGDCTEHAVLLAALLRADGIPSRVVSGLVYVPDLGGQGPGFGWHLWTQALVYPPFVAGGGARAWVDLDATIPVGGGRFHAAHIAVATSDLAGGASDPTFARALSLVGGVEISEVDAKVPARSKDAASSEGPTP